MAAVTKLVFLSLINICASTSYSDAFNFYASAVRCDKCFPNIILPRVDQTAQIVVDINFTLLNIGEFNEADGYLEVNGLMDVIWEDHLIADYHLDTDPHAVTEIVVPRDDVWVPTVTIFNSHSNISMIGESSTDVRITMPTTTLGEMKWSPAVVSRTNCAVDSTYFPFDTQKCNITLTPWGYTDSQVSLNMSNSNESLDVSYFREHELWKLKTYRADGETKSNQSFLFYELTLQRKPAYFLVTFFMPFLLFVFLSNLVFLMPSDSGERVGFAMLIFLGIAILMAMITGSLPKSSTQMSILMFYFSVMLIDVGLITYLAILSLTIYSINPTKIVPQRIVTLIACCGCYENKHKDDLFARRRRSKVSPLTLSEYDDNDDGFFSHPKFQNRNDFEDDGPMVIRKDNPKKNSNDYDITWKHVAKTFDKICFITFLVVNILITFIFFTPLLLHYYQ